VRSIRTGCATINVFVDRQTTCWWYTA